MQTPSSPYRLVSAASDNATSVRTDSTVVTGITAGNVNAAVRYLHLYNKATAPVLGTDTPVFTVPLPAAAVVSVPLPDGGLLFSVGLALAITSTTGTIPASGNVSANETSVSMGLLDVAS